MSWSTCVQWRCTCSAFFMTEDQLCEHLDEHRVRERNLQAELEKCQSHSRVIVESASQVGIQNKPVPPQRQLSCPSCERAPFAKWTNLQRHYQTHVECDEVCVCCCKFIDTVSRFIRHVDEKHTEAEAGKRKMGYLRQTCDELNALSDGKLQIALSQTSSCEVGNRQRRWDMTDSGTDPSGPLPSGPPAKYVKLNEKHVAQPVHSTESYAAEVDTHVSLSDALAAQSTTQRPLAMLSSGNAAGPVALESHPSISSQMVYTDTLEGHEGFNPTYNAPILGVLNFPPHFADCQQVVQPIREGL